MVDLSSYNNGGFGTSGGFITNRFASQTTSAGAAPVGLMPEEQTALTNRLFNANYGGDRGMGVFESTAKFATSSIIDLGDSLWGNVLNPVGERGDVWNLVGDYGGDIGSSLESYYRDNTGSIEMVSGIAGAVATGYAAGAMLLPRISNAMAKTAMISESRLWQAGAAYNAQSRARMLAAQAEAAADGIAFKTWLSPAGRQFLTNKTLRGVGTAAFEELAIAATMNGNETVWSDDMSQNAFWTAFGLGLGGTLGYIGGRAEIRRVSNDPSQIMARADAIDSQGLMAMREFQPASDYIDSLRGAQIKESATLTNLAIQSRIADAPDATSAMQGLNNTVRANANAQMLESMQKMASKGVNGVHGSQFRVDGAAKAQLTEVLKRDPMALFGSDSIGTMRDRNLEEIFKSRDDFISSLRDSENAGEIQLAHVLEQQEARIMVDGGFHTAASNDAKSFSAYKPGQVEFKKVKDSMEFYFTLDSGKAARVSDNFDVKNFHRMTVHDRFKVVEGMHTLFREMRKSQLTYNVPAKPSWFQIDAARYFESTGGTVDWSRSGLKSESDRTRASLSGKAIAAGTESLGNIWDRLRFNLPAPSSVETIYDAAGDSLRYALESAKAGGNAEDIAEGYGKLKAMHGFDLYDGKTPVKLEGNLFGFNRDERGQWMEPMIAYFTPQAQRKSMNAYGIAEQLAENKAARFHALTGGRRDIGFVHNLANHLRELPETMKSMQIRGLSDDQITGLGSPTQQLLGEALTKEMRYRDSEVMTAAMKVREAVTRSTNESMTQALRKHIGSSIEVLNNTANAGSKTLVNQFLSNASGWDLMRGSTELGDGKFGFVLADTQRNAKRLGRAVQKGEMLRNPRTGNLIVLDQRGLDVMQRFQGLFREILVDRNRVRSSMGLSDTRLKEWYTPPPSTARKYVAFTFDEFNQPVPGGAIIASTKSEFDSMIQAANRSKADKHRILTREQIGAANDLYDRAQMDWIDPGSVVNPAKGQTGALSMDTVNPFAIEDTLNWVKGQFEQLGNGVVRSMFDSQLSIARMRGAVDSTLMDKGRGLKDSIKSAYRTIWDEYEGTLLGKRAEQMGKSITGTIMQPIESFIDAALETVWPGMVVYPRSQVQGWIQDLGRLTGAKFSGKAKSFEALARELGPYTPYKNAVDYAEQTLKIVRPPDVKAISNEMNRLTASLVLRWMEIPHAAMNMIGIIATMPSIVKSGRAPLMTSLNHKAGRVGVVDTMRIMIESTRDLFKKSRHADWDFMVKNGDTTQQVAEFNKQISLIKDQTTWQRVMYGTGSDKGKKGAKGVYTERGIDGLISWLSDSTENWSRTWAHFAGLRLADYHGIQGLEARHSFARDVANSAIANYSPQNRPELFHSAFGSMFGLFASYMQNYNQRLFRWLENKQYADVGNQLALQASIFGVASLPGYKQIESMMLAAGAGQLEEGAEATLTDHIYARFGPEVGSAIAHGGLSLANIALFARGDMNYRELSFDPTQIMAGMGLAKQVATGMTEAANAILTGTAVENPQALTEILARNMPNRMIKGWLTVLANDGKDIDSLGQVTAETKGFFESSVRMLGLRSTRQQAEVEAFYSNRRMQERESNRMEKLRIETRSLLRQDGWENRIQEIFDSYVATGGMPGHFRTWIRDQLRAATGTRGMNDLTKAMRSDKSLMEVWRYNGYGAM